MEVPTGIFDSFFAAKELANPLLYPPPFAELNDEKLGLAFALTVTSLRNLMKLSS